MTVARKPRNVDEFITGAPVARETTGGESSSTDPFTNVRLRVPVELLHELDEARAQRKPKPSRHQFILELLYERVSPAS